MSADTNRRHTIVVAVPDGADADDVERHLTRRIEMATLQIGEDSESVRYGNPWVVEYHHEQMTTTEED